jgi:hypothetical protein
MMFQWSRHRLWNSLHCYPLLLISFAGRHTCRIEQHDLVKSVLIVFPFLSSNARNVIPVAKFTGSNI